MPDLGSCFNEKKDGIDILDIDLSFILLLITKPGKAFYKKQPHNPG